MLKFVSLSTGSYDVNVLMSFLNIFFFNFFFLSWLFSNQADKSFCFVCFCFYIKQALPSRTEMAQTFLQLQTFGHLVYLGHGAAACLSYLEIKCLSCPLWAVLTYGPDRYLDILEAWPVAHGYIKCYKGVNIFQEKPPLCYLLCPIYVQGRWLRWA